MNGVHRSIGDYVFAAKVSMWIGMQYAPFAVTLTITIRHNPRVQLEFVDSVKEVWQ